MPRGQKIGKEKGGEVPPFLDVLNNHLFGSAFLEYVKTQNKENSK